MTTSDGQRAGDVPPPTWQLSVLHFVVLRRVVAGWSDAQIARHLFVSERTIRRRLVELRSYLDTGTRIGMVLAATSRGWLA